MTNNLLDAREAALFMGLSDKPIYEAVKKGRIKAVTNGFNAVMRFKREDLEEWKAERERIKAEKPEPKRKRAKPAEGGL